jgi:hypothetical protein
MEMQGKLRVEPGRDRAMPAGPRQEVRLMLLALGGPARC